MLSMPESSQPRIANRWRLPLPNRMHVVALTGLAIFLTFALTVPRFLTPENLLNMLRGVALLGILSSGMTFLFVVGEMDISVGSVYGFLTVIMGILVGRSGWNPWLAM